VGHDICALVVTEPFDEGAARDWGVVANLAVALAGPARAGRQPSFAVVVTDYFGGAGE